MKNYIETHMYELAITLCAGGVLSFIVLGYLNGGILGALLMFGMFSLFFGLVAAINSGKGD